MDESRLFVLAIDAGWLLGSRICLCFATPTFEISILMRNSDIDIGTLPISERLRKCAENMLEYEFSEPEIHM